MALTEAQRKKANAERLEKVDPSIRERVSMCLEYLESQGHRPVIDGDVWRSPETQLRKFRQGVSKAKWGFHCATTKDGKPGSLAADIVDADRLWTAGEDYWLDVGRAALKAGLGWGGFFGLKDAEKERLRKILDGETDPAKVTRGWDPAHVQVAGLEISEAKAGKRPAPMKRVAKAVAIDSPPALDSEETPAPPAPSPATKLLREGDQGREVWNLQNGLAALGFLKPADVSGEFGPTTTAALERWQAVSDLRVDGIAGPATMRELYRQLALTPAKLMDSPAAPPAGEQGAVAPFQDAQHTAPTIAAETDGGSESAHEGGGGVADTAAPPPETSEGYIYLNDPSTWPAPPSAEPVQELIDASLRRQDAWLEKHGGSSYTPGGIFQSVTDRAKEKGAEVLGGGELGKVLITAARSDTLRNKLTVWLTGTSATGFIGWNYLTASAEYYRANPHMLWLTVGVLVAVALVVKPLIERQTAMQMQKKAQAHEITLETTRIGADPNLKDVKVVK